MKYMVNMRMWWGGCLLCAGAFVASCSSDEDVLASGEGTIAFDVQADTGFRSRALDEADYKELDNYTVQLLGNSGVEQEWSYAELPSKVTVPAGTYQVKAFYGEDVPASTETMYVEGLSGDVTVDGTEAEATSVKVVCRPVCAKVTVKFADTMSQYFSDWSVTFKTVALGSESFVWSKDAVDPVYLKVQQEERVTAVISYTRDGKPAEIAKEYVMSPSDGMTINVSPKVEQSEGSLNVSISIDTTTNDIEQDIEVPSDWVNQK